MKIMNKYKSKIIIKTLKKMRINQTIKIKYSKTRLKFKKKINKLKKYIF